MPIRPIDLQTLFMQMQQVGREQAAEKEGALLQSAIKGAAEQKRRDETKEAVRRPEEPEGGAPPVRDRKERGPGRKGQGPGEEGGRDGTEEEAAQGEEVVRDPDLGTKIDLSG